MLDPSLLRSNKADVEDIIRNLKVIPALMDQGNIDDVADALFEVGTQAKLLAREIRVQGL